VIGVVSGSQASAALQRQYPESTLRFQSWYTTAISALAFKQIDALWINRASAEYLTQYHQVRDLSWTFSPTIPNLNMSFGIDRQLPLLAESIDTVFKHVSLASRLRIATSWGLNRSFVITTNPLGLDPGRKAGFASTDKFRSLLTVVKGQSRLSVRGNPGAGGRLA
jgi:two-component system sensor histidine kinase EvgS